MWRKAHEIYLTRDFTRMERIVGMRGKHTWSSIIVVLLCACILSYQNAWALAPRTICPERNEKGDEAILIRIDIAPRPDLADEETTRKIMTEIVTKDPDFAGDWTNLSTGKLGNVYLLNDGKERLSLGQIVDAWRIKLAKEKTGNSEIKRQQARKEISGKEALRHIVEVVCGQKLPEEKEREPICQIEIGPKSDLGDEETTRKIMTEIVTKDPDFAGDWTNLSTSSNKLSKVYLLNDGQERLSLGHIVDAWRMKIAKKNPGNSEIKWKQAFKEISQKEALIHIVEVVCGHKLEKIGSEDVGIGEESDYTPKKAGEEIPKIKGDALLTDAQRMRLLIGRLISAEHRFGISIFLKILRESGFADEYIQRILEGGHLSWIASKAGIKYLEKLLEEKGMDLPETVLDLGAGPSVFKMALYASAFD